MVNKKLSKAERRAAFEKELAQRNRQIETAQSDRPPWDTGLLSALIKENGQRIGAELLDAAIKDPISMIQQCIQWPDGITFRSSTILFQEYLSRQGGETREVMSKEELEDAMPVRVSGFKFIEKEQTGFWPEWEKEFTGVDHESMFPIGSDDHYFYFISRNPSDSTEPLVLKVDHEEVSETPYCRDDSTLGQLLVCLERDFT